MAAIKKCDVRMYRIGTGDCFVLSFKTASGSKSVFKMMIDCGAQNGKSQVFKQHLDDLVQFVDGEVDVLVISHEHQDHVLGFQRCSDILADQSKIRFKEVWMAWTEEDGDPKVEKWKTEFGKKKRTLALASKALSDAKADDGQRRGLFEGIYKLGADPDESLRLREDFIETLAEYADLNTDLSLDSLGASGEYAGGLAGMKVVKDEVKRERTRYLTPGTTLDEDHIEALENIRIHVLGPPHGWLDIKTEHGKHGETYKHNKELELVRGLSALNLSSANGLGSDDSPFDEIFFEQPADSKADPATQKLMAEYQASGSEWRRIDFEWLFSAGELSLRLTRGINNLSLVLAIEFVDSGKVMLFPGDAEYGSWRSWHEIEWPQQDPQKKHLTEDLLNRTVFYKVAHHMSHNGTAKTLGLDMMTSPQLAAMGTVDYKVISKNWKNTMPNRGIVRDLLAKTRGKLMVMNTDEIFFDKAKTVPLQKEIDGRIADMPDKAREQFRKNLNQEKLYIQYTVDGS